MQRIDEQIVEEPIPHKTEDVVQRAARIAKDHFEGRRAFELSFQMADDP